MKILLDIDGVMVRSASWKPAETLNDGFSAFNSKAISSLNYILAATGASVVLTTSHKSNYSLPEWERIFSLRGICISVERLNENSKNLSRKDEILNWLKETNEEHFVIIDDDTSLNALPSTLKEKLVLTKAMIGLTPVEAASAVNILQSAAANFA